MTISYNWLCDYLPTKINPEVLSGILTSIGLEVESLEKYEEIKGGLQGLVVGEVMSCEKHPEADKLKITTVHVGNDIILNIVCGAPNVAVGQKVIVARIGTTIYPINGESLTLKKAKIRGVESEGMICAEDEIGIGKSHDGIKILPESTPTGTQLTELYKPYQDFIFEIGLTPNRMDAMSHLGTARDICAYLSYHEKTPYEVIQPYSTNKTNSSSNTSIKVDIKDTESCMRYCGVSISGITVTESPAWLKSRLKSIGQKPINSIVDITNYILHETGQPLHAFDANKITGNKIEVKKISTEALFKTLDEKERKIDSADLMICNEKDPMCIAGVFGGLESSVTNDTTTVFLESACFDKATIRKSSIKHGLRTEAASRFEKGVDISNTMQVLVRAALLMEEITGGKINSEFIDIYPNPKEKTSIHFPLSFLKKLSGKDYKISDAKTILQSLGFEIIRESADAIDLLVPFSKQDITIPADIVEEIMRIDGLDNIEIPTKITISPSVEKSSRKFAVKEKLANYFVGLGFSEMFTNSITNSAFYNDSILQTSVKMINSLSNELDILRPQMIESGLQVIANNLNRKNNNLRLFEFGKTYSTTATQVYNEQNHLSLYISGNLEEVNWKSPAQKTDYFYLKGVLENIFELIGLKNIRFENDTDDDLFNGSSIVFGKTIVGKMGEVSQGVLKKFDIKQPVFYADIDMDLILSQKNKHAQYKEITKFPAVNRDLALVVDKIVSYSQIEQIALSNKITQLKNIQLFDIFESEKLGAGKKSMAVSFTFLDETKTLTDQEIDAFMQKIIAGYEKSLQAEIRK